MFICPNELIHFFSPYLRYHHSEFHKSLSATQICRKVIGNKNCMPLLCLNWDIELAIITAYGCTYGCGTSRQKYTCSNETKLHSGASKEFASETKAINRKEIASF